MSEVYFYLFNFFDILLSLWWLWLTVFLALTAKYFWIWGSRDVKFYTPIKWALLEIKIPEEVEKTPKAMENVFHTLWALYDPPSNIREFWMNGKWLNYYSCEIVGKEGEVHLYLRIPKIGKEAIRAAIYGEYPNAEIEEVDDYVLDFGKKIPNEDYDLWGCDFKLKKPDMYPLRTYEYWEAETTHEEKKIDPLAGLFEILGTLNKEEEVWIQIKICPLTDDEHPYIEESRKMIDKTMKRPEETKPSLLAPLGVKKIPSDMWDVVIEGKPIPPVEEEKEKPSIMDLGLMRLSPGEAESLKITEENLGKYVYEGNIRFLYIAKREILNKAKGVAGVCGAFTQFSTEDLNGLKPDATKTKVMPWFFEKRKLFLRKRKLFRHYIKRKWPWHRKPYIFSTAELATLFHFPGKTVAPSAAAPRVEIKKGGAPPTLPTK